MTNFSQKIRKTITAGLGAALISTLFVVAAVGPATTATAGPRGHHSGPGLIPGARPDGREPPPSLASGRRLTLRHPRFGYGTPMSIFSRTRDIIAANVIDLLERSDDPAKTIRVIILEMEETLVEVRASAARLIADQKEKRQQIARLAALTESWTERAELALSRGREDLARLALVEKEKLAGLTAEIGEEVGSIEQALRSLEGDIAKLQAKLREARVRQNAVATRLESAENRVRLREAYAGQRTEAAFEGFETLERQADYAEGQADALLLAAPPRTLEEEIAELRVADRVDAELEAMKARRLAA